MKRDELTEEQLMAISGGDGSSFVWPTCPKCGSDDTECDAELHYGKVVWICRTCGNQFEYAG